MGCGCRGGGPRRVNRPAAGPAPVSQNINNAARLRALENSSSRSDGNVTGLSKEQRDAERKKRIQAIIAKRSGQ
jgi:hypothetical protein